MKKPVCLILSAALLALTGCGSPESPAPETPAVTEAPTETAAPEASPVPAQEPEALPESCMIYYDAAETGGATAEGDERPYFSLADGGVSESYSVRLPDGSCEALLTLPFGEGVTLEEFSGGGAERLRGVYTLAWNGEKYYSFGISADNCAIPNLSPDVGGGVLRLDIEGDCRVNGGGEQYWFAGALKLQNAEPPSLIPWGAAHIVLSGENRITENLGGASLVFSGDGSLTAEKDAGVWGWGAVHAPVVAVLGGASVTVQCEEFAVGSESGGEGLFLVDGGSFTAEHNLWLQNAVLEVRSGTLHIQGDLAMERGKIIVSGGELLVEGSVWLGEGDVIVSGGELVIPGGKDALALDAGTLTLTGGAVREP